MKVKDILQTKGSDVSTVTKDRPIMEVVAELTERKVGALVVLDDAGKVAGILSERDVVRALGHHGVDIAKYKTADFMTSDVQTCTRETSIDQVMATMTHGRFRHLPIVEKGQLTGIISIGDVVKARIQELEHEREVLKSYIAS